MAFEKSEGGVEKGDGALGGFIREELCEGEARVVIDGDVETLGAVAGIGVLGVAREAVTRLDKAGELLDVEMNEGLFTLSKGFDDESEVDESSEHHIEFLETREDAAEALESAEESFDFVAAAIHGLVVFPRRKPVAFRRHDRGEPQIQSQLAHLVPFVGAIHDEMASLGHRLPGPQQVAPLGRVSRLSRRQGKTQGAASIRGHQMNFGAPPAAALSDGLRAVFFKAPVPSGCTLMIVLSSDTASSLMRTICSRCIRSKTRSKTPPLLQRFMRV